MSNTTVFRIILLCFPLYFSWSSLASVHAVSLQEKEREVQIEDILEKAALAEASSSYDQALKLYGQALHTLDTHTNISKEALVLKKMGLLYYRQNKLERAQHFFERCIAKDPATLEAADSYFNLALIQRRLKQNDSLFYFLRHSLALFNTASPSEKKFETYLKAGILFKNNGDYKDALTYLLQAHKGYGILNNLSKKAVVSNTIGATHRLMENYPISLDYYRESLGYRISLNDSVAIAHGYNNLGNLFKASQQLDSARIYYIKAITLKKILGNQRELGRTLSNLAAVYAEMKATDLAYNTYIEAMAIKRKEEDSLALLTTFNELAYLKTIAKEYTSARSFLDSIEHYENEIENKEVLLRSIEVKSFYFKKIGVFEKALKYQQQYNQLYQQIFKEKQSRQIHALQEKYESQKKQTKISELEAKNAFNTSIIAFQRKDIHIRDLLLAISLLILLIFLGIYLVLKQRQKIKKKAFEYEKLQAVLKGQELLKEEISKDLHDIIAVNYEGIRLKINALEKSDKPKLLLARITSEIKDVNHQVRLISHRLSPMANVLKKGKLSNLIVSRLSEIQHYSAIDFDIDLPLPAEIDIMKEASQTNFYSILLEVIHNSLKHSNAKNIRISHSKERSDIIKFSIYDNGNGFKKEEGTGIGLGNIHQRAALLKGSIDIQSSPSGTLVELQFPIKPNTV